MRKALIALTLLLLFAQGVSAQRAADTSRPERYDPERPVWHDPYFYRYYRNHHGHGRHHHRRDGHDRDVYTRTPGQHDMDETIAQAFVAARRKLVTEHQSRLIKAWELVVDHALVLNGDASSLARIASSGAYRRSHHAKLHHGQQLVLISRY